MRTAKSSKIVLLFITMALSLIAFSICFFAPTSALAANPDDARDYFSSSEVVEFKNDGVSTTVEEEGYLAVDSPLALDNLGFEVKANSSIKTLGVKVDTLAFVTSGNVKVNKDGEKELITTVEHSLLITANGNALTLSFNGESANATLTGNLDIVFKVENNVLSAIVEGVEIYSDEAEYLVYDIDTCIAEKVQFSADELLEGVNEAEILILSVDQDVTDVSGKYKQTFTLNADGEVEKLATPYGIVSNGFVNYDGKINLKSLYKNTLTLRGLSVLGELSNKNIKLEKTDENDSEIWFENIANPKAVLFQKAGVKYINIETNLSTYENRVLRTLAVNVYDEDTVAPKYDEHASVEMLEAYNLAVEKAVYTENKDGEKTYIRLGENYVVPSLENFVTDDLVPYSKLNATVHYKTPTDGEGTSSDFEIPVESAGDYTFYVVFEDLSGNAMEEDDFFTVSEEDENDITYGKYENYIFHFHVEDDTDFDIDASKILGTGFVGQLYTATDFRINASNYTKNYKLFYNAKENATSSDEGWVEILPASKLTNSYENEVFTAEDIEEIDYNGKLSFTPDRVGSYKIVCTIVSDNSIRAAEAEAIFSVEKPSTVKPYKPLETREVLAIVFLSVGGVCLIGIIALIFVKPEEKTDAE